MHWACGKALPTDPPKPVLMPIPFRIFTALKYGSPITFIWLGFTGANWRGPR